MNGGGGGERVCTFAITVLGLNLAELNYHISPKFGSSKVHPAYSVTSVTLKLLSFKGW